MSLPSVSPLTQTEQRLADIAERVLLARECEMARLAAARRWRDTPQQQAARRDALRGRAA